MAISEKPSSTTDPDGLSTDPIPAKDTPSAVDTESPPPLAAESVMVEGVNLTNPTGGALQAHPPLDLSKLTLVTSHATTEALEELDSGELEPLPPEDEPPTTPDNLPPTLPPESGAAS